MFRRAFSWSPPTIDIKLDNAAFPSPVPNCLANSFQTRHIWWLVLSRMANAPRRNAQTTRCSAGANSDSAVGHTAGPGNSNRLINVASFSSNPDPSVLVRGTVIVCGRANCRCRCQRESEGTAPRRRPDRGPRRQESVPYVYRAENGSTARRHHDRISGLPL